MSIDDTEEPEGRQPQLQATLGRIADMLGCSAEDFLGGASEPLAVKGVSELLTIWAEIDDDADRERLLEFARQLAVSR